MEITNEVKQDVLSYIEWYGATYPEYNYWTCTAIKEWVLDTHNIELGSLSQHSVQYIAMRTVWSQLLDEHRVNKGFPIYDGVHPFLELAKKHFGIELLVTPENEDKVYARINIERKEFIDWVKKELTTCLS